MRSCCQKATPGATRAAGACLAIYSIGGLISPLHYTEGSLPDLGVFQHVFIVTDALAGGAVLAFAIWLPVRNDRVPAAVERAR